MSPQPHSYTKLGWLILTLVIVVLTSSRLFSGPLKGWRPQFNLTDTFSFAFQSESLSKIVKNNLEGKKGDYAVFIYDPLDQENYSLNGSQEFPAASLYKLFLIAAVLNEVEKGNLSLEDTVSSTKSHLLDVYGGVDFGYEKREEKITYTIEEALERVGRISDNFASIMLAEKIGWEKAQNVADSLGASNTKIKDPISTTASDIGLFFKLLYQNKVISEFVSQKSIEFLSLNQLNDRIPAKLPEGVKVVHKTGELSRLRHDAGIVYLNSGMDSEDMKEASESADLNTKAYIVVTLSRNLPDEEEGIETVANLSRAVYDYFENKYK